MVPGPSPPGLVTRRSPAAVGKGVTQVQHPTVMLAFQPPHKVNEWRWVSELISVDSAYVFAIRGLIKCVICVIFIFLFRVCACVSR